MMSSYQKDRDAFVGVVTGVVVSHPREFPQWSRNNAGVELARLILRNAATLQRLAEAACERELTGRELVQEGRCQRRILDACTPWDIRATVGGDPRGAVVKLILPNGEWNSWGGPESGYCVPTR